MQKIIILDFGSQTTQLIGRRVRELNTFCEILPYNKFPENDPDVIGVILSGSPLSVYADDAFHIGLQRYIHSMQTNYLNRDYLTSFQQIITIHQQNYGFHDFQYPQQRVHCHEKLMTVYSLLTIYNLFPVSRSGETSSVDGSHVEAKTDTIELFGQVTNGLQRAVSAHGGNGLQHLQQVLALKGEGKALGRTGHIHVGAEEHSFQLDSRILLVIGVGAADGNTLDISLELMILRELELRVL